MLYMTADHACRTYLRNLEAAGSPRSASLTISAGRSYAPRCKSCGGLERVSGSSRHGDPSERCRRCGTLWPYEDVEVPRGTFGPRGPADVEDRLATIATLGTMLARLKLWPRRVLMLYATDAFSLDALVEECAQRWPRRVEVWTTYRVRSDLRDARVALERQLRRAGLLADAT